MTRRLARPVWRRRQLACAVLACLIPWLAAAAAAEGAAESAAAAHAESLVRERYHEGFPPEFGAQISAAGAAHLALLLKREDMAAHHATIIEALGASGQSPAFAALVAYSLRETGAAVDARRFRALRALPMAMGRLAADDPRALRWLLDAAAAPGAAPFRAGPHSREEVGERLRAAALYGLGVSGRPEALSALQAGAASDRARTRRAAQAALALHAEEAAE